ncbi:FliO/MopB family protein [Halanaerobium salsuginis]|jgi:flagellar protein FliO/FliZ|uniref:Flagellar protein FliO/FliZ n=1 Tax=Halanaerobium salsuginis TaxID=29563 RepID=A0A1I4KJ28_9FIRM|nr:flagellar biosynthetic protein FliO [Halanaerobium salsuginis]SFL78526.1 flagellar protein FliO/FliZ [Halanaerobium salsuginis]
MNYIWETFKIAFFLVLIIAFILAIYYLVKNKFSLNTSKKMEIIDSMRLANGEMIYLVKLFDEVIMLGGTKEEVSFLKSWPQAEVDLTTDKENSNLNFKNTFNKFLAKKGVEKKNSKSEFNDKQLDDSSDKNV